MTLTTPALVEELLPENGGGRVTSVCASNTHTCAVTDTGDVYSWGYSLDSGSLGHGKSMFQPTPKRVIGVKRAIQVATGAHHTIILTSYSLPSLPYHDSLDNKKDCSEHIIRSSSSTNNILHQEEEEEEELDEEEEGEEEADKDRKSDQNSSSNKAGEINYHKNVLSLKQYSEIALAKNVDITNVSQVLNYAKILAAHELASYCSQFILQNLDAFLTQCKSHDLDILLEDTLMSFSNSSQFFSNSENKNLQQLKQRSDSQVTFNFFFYIFQYMFF